MNFRNYHNLNYVYTKRRRDFGRQPLFQNVQAHMIDSIYYNRQEEKDYILRNPVHKEVQAIMPQSQHEINTKLQVHHTQGINHVEGGWPKEVHLGNEEHVERYCRRVRHEDNYVRTVLSLAPTINHLVDQNNAIDMYQTYFAEIPKQTPVEKYKIHVSNAFRDLLHRPVSSVVWTHEKKTKLAVSYCDKSCEKMPSHDSTNECYIWDLRQQYEPLSRMLPTNPCWKLACSPGDPNLLLAGLENGHISLFDIREGPKPVASTDPYNSHGGPVSAMLYLHTRTNTEFFTGSLDGQCLWWDTRKLSKPSDKLFMSINLAPKETANLNNAQGISTFQYDKNVPTKFLCGTEAGLVLNVNRLGKDHGEKIHSYWETHTGVVRAVHRSPCTYRMFITCGDYTVRIWSEEVRSAPIIVSRPYRYFVTDVAWSPRRLSSYMSICAGGFFYYWDLLRSYKDAVISKKLSDYELTNISPHETLKLVAVSDKNGSVFLLELCETMVESGSHDKTNMSRLYERETRREHIIDNRVKEIRVKARHEEVQDATLAPDENMPEEEELERETEKEFWKVVKEEQRKIEELMT